MTWYAKGHCPGRRDNRDHWGRDCRDHWRRDWRRDGHDHSILHRQTDSSNAHWCGLLRPEPAQPDRRHSNLLVLWPLFHYPPLPRNEPINTTPPLIHRHFFRWFGRTGRAPTTTDATDAPDADTDADATPDATPDAEPPVALTVFI